MLAEVCADRGMGKFVGIPTRIGAHPFARFIVVRTYDRRVRDIDIRVRPKFSWPESDQLSRVLNIVQQIRQVVPKLLSGTPTDKNRKHLEIQDVRDDGCIFRCANDSTSQLREFSPCRPHLPQPLPKPKSIPDFYLALIVFS